MIDISILRQAISLTYEGKYKEAEDIYNRLLEENPNEGALYSTVGLFYINCKNYSKAAEYLRKACNIKESLGTVSALGFAEYEMGHYEEAAKILEHALDFGENVDIYNRLILSLFEIKSYKKAIELTEKMCELYPDNPKSVANRVKSLTQSGKLFDAEKVCVEYLREHPEEPTLWYHLGLLKELIYSDDEKAVECYKIAGANGNLGADYNIAVAYQKLGEFQKAEEYYNKYLKQFPDDDKAITSLGICCLSQKKFQQGYKYFYNRTKGKAEKYTNNLWQPDSELEEELVVICDQGFGDHIQFIRYLPFLKTHRIKVAVGQPLKTLFRENYPNIEFIDYSEINPDVQAVRITDLAYVLNMDFNNIPFAEGYIKSEASVIKSDKMKVGICWEAGAAGIRGMINRTINVRCFEPLFNLKNIQLYSFQVTDTLNGNEKYADKMVNLAKDFRNFSDTAKALSAMDVVISVDTSVAHLAGALGTKTYLLLPYAPDWRWFRGAENGSETPWYKSVELFCQQDHISWEKEINEITEKLSLN